MNGAVEAQAVVYVVDDDVELRKAITWTLQSAGYRVECFGSPNEFLHAVDPTAMGCALLDLRLPEMNGLELQQRLQELNETMPFIVISAYADVPSTVTAMRQGAIDVLEKPCDRQQLLDAVEAALARAAALREQIGEEDVVASRMATLTERERQVLDRMLEGELTKHIASQLGISPKTVEVHRSRIRAKLRVESTTQLARMMMVYLRRGQRRPLHQAADANGNGADFGRSV